ncbi:MAG: L,D-transpeptidase family protein [Proteobacteria bacterium]|nr:L,D-transpeptidase family protein [Pseudomonadota bacterium]
MNHRVYLLISMLLLATPAEAEDSIANVPEPSVKYLPAYLLEVPESVGDILIADTGSATLLRYAQTRNGIVERDRRYMSIGRKGVGKRRAWDRKTPLGIYFITEELDSSKLAAKYGIAAFSLDYPNAWDRYNERTGSGIWLHGVDASAPNRPPLDTDGCLALPNEELALLVAGLTPQVTPIIVVREMRWSTPSDLEALRIEFRIALEQWRASLEQGDLLTYLSLYDDAFRSRGMDKQKWSAYRLGVFGARQLAAVNLQDVMLLADPEEQELFVSRFKQTLMTEHGPVTTRKRLYWRRTGSEWRIVAEDAG